MADADKSTHHREVQARYRKAGRKPGKARPHRPQKPCEYDGCEGWAWAQGYCDRHYQRLKRLGIIQSKRIVDDPVARFRARYRVNDVTGCWEWTGTIVRRGYGTLGFGGKVKHVKAHRFSFELHCGDIPADLCVLHECDNRRCVNPAHLFLGTDLTNARDCAAKGRSAGLIGKVGPKLTVPMVTTIRVLYARGRHSFCQLADIYGLDEETTRRIIKGSAHLGPLERVHRSRASLGRDV